MFRNKTTLLIIGLVFVILLFHKQNNGDDNITEIASSNKAFFRRRHNLNCAELFNGEKEIEKSGYKPILDSEYAIWQTFDSCQRIRERNFYPTEVEYGRKFPLAYVVLLSDGLLQFETLFSTIYNPNNIYCIHIDFKASYLLHSGVRNLSKCFKNIVFAKESFPISGNGLNMLRAIDSCFQTLVKHRWKYVFILQETDFPLRTNAELVDILRLHKGANDVELLRANPTRYGYRSDRVYGPEGYAVGLNRTNISKAPISGLTIYKGSVGATLSRKFVDFIVNNRKSKELLTWLDDTYYGDELYWATLNHDSGLKAPGGYPGRCLKHGTKTWITRFSVWSTYTHLKCGGMLRHTVCVFGIRDLPMLKSRPELFLNKFMLSYEPSAAFCMQELLFNRTYIPHSREFNIGNYEKLSSVQYQKWILSGKSSENFQCVTCDNCQH